MVVSLFLALAARPDAVLIPGNIEWEETPTVQRAPVYHPKLRFQPESKFVFETPYLIAEGHYQRDGDNYAFRPETAIQLNHADVDKLVADLNPEERAKRQDAYAKSLNPFSATYNEGDVSLSLNLGGLVGSYTLYPYNAGDDQRANSVSDSESALVGVWNAPEPFPDRLDSKTRYRIGGLEGLNKFSEEAMASDGAQFGLLDLRKDETLRMHALEGMWKRDGSTLILIVEGHESRLTISSDGQKLQVGGKTAYVRN